MYKTTIMKKKLVFVSALLLAGTMVLNAQGFQRRTVEERVKRVMDTLTTVLKLEGNVKAQADSVFTEYYKATDKLREGRQQGERPDRAQMDKLISDRDEKLKKVFTEDQFKKFKEEIEPALRPQRRGQR